MDRLRARVGGWEGRVHVKGGHGWAGLMLTPPGPARRRAGVSKNVIYCIFCINLHAISKTPLLTNMKHSLQFAQTY